MPYHPGGSGIASTRRLPDERLRRVRANRECVVPRSIQLEKAGEIGAVAKSVLEMQMYGSQTTPLQNRQPIDNWSQRATIGDQHTDCSSKRWIRSPFMPTATGSWLRKSQESASMERIHCAEIAS